MQTSEMAARLAAGNGFIAALDQSGGSTPKALKGYGVEEGALVSVAGGGDTVAALAHAGAAQDFTYISTAGGAFLEWMEGRELPGVAALSI